MLIRCQVTALLLCTVVLESSMAADSSIDQLAKKVTIYRDSFGVPHIDAEDQSASAFGMAYVQAEDYFWQIEDSLAWGTGRYAELYGKDKIDDDLTTHAFEIPRRSQTQLDQVPAATRKMGEAFAAGLNHYLACHPEVKPRMFTDIEPWHLLAFGRRVYLELIFKASHVGGRYHPARKTKSTSRSGRMHGRLDPSRTKDGTTMLFINPQSTLVWLWSMV